MSQSEIVIVGGGHNGLICGAVLAKRGLKVAVLEGNTRLGGGVTTDEVTLPGFKHDLYGSSHVWIHANPDCRAILPELEALGLKYLWARDGITGHPAREGPGIVVYKDIDKTCASIAQYSDRDARRYREIYDNFREIEDGFITGMFSPPNPASVMQEALESTEEGIDLLRTYAMSPYDFVMENFEHPVVQTFLVGWATAPGVGPHMEGRGELFFIMIPAIHVYGESIPEGGSIALPQALAKMVESYGGEVHTGVPVTKILVGDRREARGAELADGRTFHASKAVVNTLNPKIAYPQLFDDGVLDADFLRRVENFNVGDFSIVRVHYALHEPPNYLCSPEVTNTPYQRIYESVRSIVKQWSDVYEGKAPEDPFLWVATWTTKDPTRAPDGKHTLIMDTFVPKELASGEDWEAVGQKYIDTVELAKLREYTDNMTDGNIMAQYVQTGSVIQRDNPCLVDGTTTGGAMRQYQSGFLRPFPGYSQYRGPIENLYFAGPYCHPGGSISGAGTITARVILQDLGLERADF